MTLLVLSAVIAVAILVLLGIPLGLAVGLRGMWLWAASGPFAVTTIGTGAVLAAWLGVEWSLLPVAVLAAVVTVVIVLRRRGRSALSQGGVRSGPAAWWTVAALAAAAAVMTVHVLAAVGLPEAISQTFDNIFHLNGIRHILTTGSASSLTLGGMTSPDGSLPFYPAAWHGWAALVVQLTGASIPIAVNAVVLATCAVVWPASAVLLSRTLVGRSPVVAVAAALIATAIPAFPLLLMQYGVLYPLQLGFALLPVGVAAVAGLVRITAEDAPPDPLTWVLVLIGVVPGLGLAHPGAFVALLALTTPFAVIVTIRQWRRSSTARRRGIVTGGFLVYLVAGVLAVKVLRPPLEARLWPTQLESGEAVGQVLSVSMWYGVPAVLIAVAIVAGVIGVLIDRGAAAIALLGVHLIGVVLFLAVAALPVGDLRDALTGSWYNNFPRLAALLAIVMVPMGVYGVVRVVEQFGRVISRRRRPGRPLRLLIAITAAALFGLLVQIPQMPHAVAVAAKAYAITGTSPLLSTDEYALLERLHRHVPEGVTVAGSSWTGASLASAIADRPVLLPHTLMRIDEDTALIDAGLDEAIPGSPVCAAVERRGVGFVLDFGDREVHGEHHPMPGLDDLAGSGSVRLVDQEGDARLYEVTGCR